MKSKITLVLIYFALIQIILLSSCSYINNVSTEIGKNVNTEVGRTEAHRPYGTYYGVVLGYGISLTFNGDTIEIAQGIQDSIPQEIKTYKVNWQEYDLFYSKPNNIDCIPLTEIATGIIKCYWFKYIENYDFVLYGYQDYSGKLQTIELHKR
jgi:hypothetical protein